MKKLVVTRADSKMTEMTEGGLETAGAGAEGLETAGFFSTLATDVGLAEAGGGLETGPLGVVTAAAIGTGMAVLGYTATHAEAVGRTIETDTKHFGRDIKAGAKVVGNFFKKIF